MQYEGWVLFWKPLGAPGAWWDEVGVLGCLCEDHGGRKPRQLQVSPHSGEGSGLCGGREGKDGALPQHALPLLLALIYFS